ncbi:evolutionarily conserved signaling intermediate in Toll pathway, mitochondrial [Diprion similis]|uniref:evolutionarily conserved signaling intermediate in Toll pathway, mitochondrial n=1 Tax=Diprion similis TaxID=362088 RepID=UPI001EF9204B|nr:evolutionarily conserved signaling intermediate in Toll pathway, mitochondrial [Diprion similis]
MTSIIRRSYVLLRAYPGMRKRLILHDLKSCQPTTALRCISVTSACMSKDKSEKKNEGSKAVGFYAFADVKSKEKKTYLDVLRMFIDRDIQRRGHVEFIYAAMKHMEEFGVEKDLEVYKSLLNVLPKGKFIPENKIQAEFMHYPKQQQCAIDVLEQMENNGVMPDREMQDILLNTFGKLGFPLRKYWRMMYWMPKFKNASPWPLPDILPNDSLELAKLAIERITSVDLLRKTTVFQAKDLQDSIDDTWIVSGMSIGQKKLLNKHATNVPLYVEGPFRLWLKNLTINYFVLRGDPVPKPDLPPPDDDDVTKIELPFFKTEKSVVTHDETSIHEQEDGTIFAVCATGTSSRDSLLSWIRFLEKDNDVLANIPIIFTAKSPLGSVALTNNKSDKTTDEKVENKTNKE